MKFYVYKIINKINKKFYIGQTTGSIQERLQEHINSAITYRLDTPLARAIRKHGSDNFYVELIDVATTKEDLNQKEICWIKTLNAIRDGYNASEGGEGGNTYIRKTESELSKIKEKIRASKIGSKNPNSTSIKCKNVITGQELIFPTVIACKEYFKEKNHNFITRRCSGKTKYVYAGKWIFAYSDCDYFDDYHFEKNICRKKAVKIVDIKSNDECVFSSYANAELHFGFRCGFFSGDAYKHKDSPYWEKAGYRIFVLQ